jgi:PadR family transcriptional regulator PadR
MGNPGASLMSGIPELLLLRLLARREMYGYELARDVRLATGEAIDLGEGVLYPALHALEKRKYLASRRRAVDGRTRIYYRITPAGRRRLDRLMDDWRRIAAGVGAALERSSAHD